MNMLTTALTYRTAERQYDDAALGKYRSFAIEAVNETDCVLAILEDFSVVREEAEEFAALITEARLDPVHLADAAADYLFLHYSA